MPPKSPVPGPPRPENNRVTRRPGRLRALGATLALGALLAGCGHLGPLPDTLRVEPRRPSPFAGVKRSASASPSAEQTPEAADAVQPPPPSASVRTFALASGVRGRLILPSDADAQLLVWAGPADDEVPRALAMAGYAVVAPDAPDDPAAYASALDRTRAAIAADDPGLGQVAGRIDARQAFLVTQDASAAFAGGLVAATQTRPMTIRGLLQFDPTDAGASLPDVPTLTVTSADGAGVPLIADRVQPALTAVAGQPLSDADRGRVAVRWFNAITGRGPTDGLPIAARDALPPRLEDLDVRWVAVTPRSRTVVYASGRTGEPRLTRATAAPCAAGTPAGSASPGRGTPSSARGTTPVRTASPSRVGSRTPAASPRATPGAAAPTTPAACPADAPAATRLTLAASGSASFATNVVDAYGLVVHLAPLAGAGTLQTRLTTASGATIDLAPTEVGAGFETVRLPLPDAVADDRVVAVELRSDAPSAWAVAGIDLATYPHR